MTTSLHMNSIDLFEFTQASVQLFVDAAYSGTADTVLAGTEVNCVVQTLANQLSELINTGNIQGH